jgi:hypothetical protein
MSGRGRQSRAGGLEAGGGHKPLWYFVALWLTVLSGGIVKLTNYPKALPIANLAGTAMLWAAQIRGWLQSLAQQPRRFSNRPS